MYRKYNPNPIRFDPVGDCTVRALAKALGISWEEAHVMLDYNSYMMGDVSTANSVMAATLRQNGFYRGRFPDDCNDCITAEEFTREFPNGTYVLGFGDHVATVVDGVLYDAWDSSDETPLYFFVKG